MGAYLVGVADDAHFSALRILKVGERRHNEVERGVVEVAKTLVDEEAADAQIVLESVASPKASARLTTKVSPPESELT